MVKTGYFVEDLDSLPVGIVASAMEGQVPRSFAVAYTLWCRLRARIGWRPDVLGASKWEPNVTWRDDSAPGGALTLWSPWLEQLDTLDYEPIGWTESPTIGAKREANLWLRGPDGTIFAQLNWTMISSIVSGTVGFQSYLSADRQIQTLAIRDRWQRDLIEYVQPDYIDAVAVKTNSVHKLMKIHHDRCSSVEPRSLSAEEFKQEHSTLMERFFRRSLERGYLRELTPREVRRLIEGTT
ncbi:MAG: hypothetical protein R3C05_22100 [Pirellulaceae bacterium]